MNDYTVAPARYAKRMMAVACPSSNGFKTRAARLAGALSRDRYSNRENAYIMSQRAAERFQVLYAAGWDACVITLDLLPPEDYAEAQRQALAARASQPAPCSPHAKP